MSPVSIQYNQKLETMYVIVNGQVTTVHLFSGIGIIKRSIIEALTAVCAQANIELKITRE